MKKIIYIFIFILPIFLFSCSGSTNEAELKKQLEIAEQKNQELIQNAEARAKADSEPKGDAKAKSDAESKAIEEAETKTKAEQEAKKKFFANKMIESNKCSPVTMAIDQQMKQLSQVKLSNYVVTLPATTIRNTGPYSPIPLISLTSFKLASKAFVLSKYAGNFIPYTIYGGTGSFEFKQYVYRHQTVTDFRSSYKNDLKNGFIEIDNVKDKVISGINPEELNSRQILIYTNYISGTEKDLLQGPQKELNLRKDFTGFSAEALRYAQQQQLLRKYNNQFNLKSMFPEIISLQIFKDMEYEQGKVKRVIDGDTIELEDGRTIRYLGIDTPELGKTNAGYASNAFIWNRSMLISDLSNYIGKEVRLYKGNQNKDSYGRYLRYVTIMTVDPYNMKSYEFFINDMLLKYGFAIHREEFENQQLSDIYNQFVNSEKEAKINRRGLWGGCK